MLCLALALLGLFPGSCATEKTCKSDGVTADIFFLLDASHWVTEIDFKHILDFVKSFVDSFFYGPDNVRVGMTPYSGGVNKVIPFTKHKTREALCCGMNYIQYHGGDARLHTGLLSAQTVFTERHGDRETAPNFLIVISGGRSSNFNKTKAKLAPLARKGVTFYTIGVGASADEEEFDTIVYPPIRVFHAENAQALRSIKDRLVGDICRDIERASGNTQQGARVACKSDRVTADVFFLLDASHWVTKNDLKHILDFVKSFVDSFIYGPDNVRVGMTPYSGGVNMLIHFKQFPTREILYYRLNYIQYNGGDARLHTGLLTARSAFTEIYGDRETASNTLIVISGGRSSKPDKTRAMLAPLARKVVTIYTIGVGASADEEELETIAYPPIRVFHAENAQALSSIKDQLVGDICREIKRQAGSTQQGAGVACKSDGVTADIFFLLDASHWVTEIDFKHILDFVKSFVDSFFYGPDNVRVGMTPYSGGGHMMIHFTQFTTRKALFYVMNRIQYHGGDARLHLGLFYAGQAFGDGDGDRETAPNFLIVISGGRSSNPDKTKAMLAPLARKGVTIYTIGVGASADEEELQTIAYPPIRVFHAENAQALSSIKDQLVGDICREIEHYLGNTQQGAGVACKPDGVTADIFFLLDASHWVTEIDFKHMLDFVKSFVDSFIYGPDNVRVGITPYSGGGHMMIHFTQFTTKKAIFSAMNHIQYNGGDARLHLGLFYADKVFSDGDGDRETAPNILIVISGGRSSDPDKTKAMLARLARKGVTIYTIGVGASADEEELETIAYPPIRVFQAENAQALSSIKDQLVGDICRDWNMTKSKV